MKTCLKITALLALLIVTAACNRKSKNAVFERLQPSSNQYKRELTRQLQATDAANLTFLFNKYVVIDGKDYLDILIKGNGIDAQAMVLVNRWDKISAIKATKGIGYSGAELKDLKLAFINNNANASLLYKGVSEIVD